MGSFGFPNERSMIYTITFNPAIDYVVHATDITMGAVNRSSSEEIYFGGKGINVSIVLNELGVESKALGFVAGFTGRAIEEGLSKQGISTDFVHLESGYSRINVKIKSTQETEINGQGPKILESDIGRLFQKLDSVQNGDTVVLAGSIPNSLPNDIYERIFEHLKGKSIKMVVDTTKDLLMRVLKYKPFLIKPNNFELSEIFGKDLTTTEEVLTYAQRLKDMGAVNVLVSMASEGAVLIDEHGVAHTCGVCKGSVKNSVGAGDSMLAGFIVGSTDGDYDYALKLGTATGGATTFSDGLATRDEILRLLEQLDGVSQNDKPTI